MKLDIRRSSHTVVRVRMPMVMMGVWHRTLVDVCRNCQRYGPSLSREYCTDRQTNWQEWCTKFEAEEYKP